MEKSLKVEIEEFWGSLFSYVLKEYLDSKEVNIVEPIQDFPEREPSDVLYEISYKSNKKDWTWAEITLVYPHNDAAKHVHQAAISGQRDTPEQQEALDSTVKSALRGSSEEKGAPPLNPDHQATGNWVSISEQSDMTGQQESLDAILVKSALSGSFDKKGEPVLDPDRKMAKLCKQRILRKMQKKSYGHLCEEYGRGHLLAVIPYQTYPLVNRNTVQHVESILSHTLLIEQHNFRSLWIAHKQPEVDNLIIVHDPAYSPRYAFYSLWPERKLYIV